MNELWIDFVNSDWRDHLGHGRDEDRLRDPEWLGRFLDRWSLPRIDLRRRDHHARLRELRASLQRFVTSLTSGEGLGEADLALLNDHLADGRVEGRIAAGDEGYRLELASRGRGLETVLSAIAVSFVEFLVDADVGRLKTCDNPNCGWVFYDTTRSRTRRWCDEGCGNLVKVRRFRERARRSRR